MADTASLVVALSAQLTQFEKDMKSAGIMADQATNDIEKKFSSMNPKISTSFFGNLFANLATKGLDAAVAAITKLIDRFDDLKKVAEYAATVAAIGSTGCRRLAKKPARRSTTSTPRSRRWRSRSTR